MKNRRIRTITLLFCLALAFGLSTNAIWAGTDQTETEPLNSGGKHLAGPMCGQNILAFYRQFSAYTDPGEYEDLYTDLPESLVELCALIKAQLINPFADLEQYLDIIPQRPITYIFEIVLDLLGHTRN